MNNSNPSSTGDASKHKWQRWVIALFSLAGLAIMVYLTYIHFTQAQSFCDISEGISCDVVTTSVYSEVFGVPMSILGVLYFGLVLGLMFFSKREKLYQILFLLTLFVLLPSLYLSALELLVIHSWCVLCESSKLLMIAILLISLTQARRETRITGRLIAPVIIAGLLAVAVTFFAQTGNTTREDYSDFVGCLNERGVVYYMSFRCSNCQRQEKLFGVAYDKLNRVECHPDGQGGDPELCLAKKIDKTPTFMIERDGQEVRRKEGLTPLKDLAELADCELK